MLYAQGLAGDDAASGELYVRYAKKAVEKGDEYLAKELARVEKIVEAGAVGGAKADEMAKKVGGGKMKREGGAMADEMAKMVGHEAAVVLCIVGFWN